ncbi:MAG: cellulase family glycosylhydrolase [Bacteroides sp.]|nr:cellulase family glycosylhydrolase [Eubacterium sp.]MCM1418559.1 cellulase family glycosylhydrolase [Roseburia sp.]MCM1462614.1 cellulase family glycosylhydrolase [Bacteroides sp.]
MKDWIGFKKGVNLGGWLSQCKGNYNDAHYASFITEEDVERIAAMGLDHVRLPVDYNVIQEEDGRLIESGFAHIDRCLSWCQKSGLNVVLDLHKACGFVFDDKSYCSFFSDERLQDQFIALWEELSRRYGDRDNIAFELLNEVTSREFADPWNRISARAIRAIRAIAPKTRIVLGGIFNDSIYGLTLLEPPFDENIVLTFHCYSPLVFTHQGAGWVDHMPADFRIAYPSPANVYAAHSRAMFGEDFAGEFAPFGEGSLTSGYFDAMFAPAVALAEKYDLPLYCGEYGVIDQADPESTLRWYRDIHAAHEKYGIARAAWSYKEMDFGLIDPHYEGIINELTELL